MSIDELINMLRLVSSKHAALCLSGGADGADLMWGEYAKRQRHGVIHWSFDGHRTMADPADRIILTNADLRRADPFCERANRSLKRRFPAKSLTTTNLLRRDWYQSNFADSCYAVSTFDIDSVARIQVGACLDARHSKVAGGTAWAMQMFIDRFNGESCECYLFDQVACYWFKWVGAWQRIYAPPLPQGIWAGVGRRDLLPLGRLAIRALLDKQLVAAH